MSILRPSVRLITALEMATTLAAAAACMSRPSSAAGRLRIAISYPASASTASLDGRVLLMLSTSDRREPRFQISDNDATQQIFGVDAEGLKPGQDAIIDASALGYPKASLSDVPPGEYFVQA